jgi:ribose-phosphate pyrophosphokinase
VEGFFQIPTENLSTLALLGEALKRDLDSRTIVVSPDPGRVKLAAQFAAQLDCPVAALQKERMNGDASAITIVLGDVRGRACLVIDDMISTGGTINNAIKALMSAGATRMCSRGISRTTARM